MSDPNQPLRIEDFRSDCTHEEIQAAEALNTRSIAMQAYLRSFPAFLHMRQLTEFIQGRRHFAPDEGPLGGWVLMRHGGRALAVDTEREIEVAPPSGRGACTWVGFPLVANGRAFRVLSIDNCEPHGAPRDLSAHTQSPAGWHRRRWQTRG